MADIKVLGERVLVKEFPAETQISGIVIPRSGQQDKSQGVVIKCGEGAMNEMGMKMPMYVKPFDHVIYADFAGAPIMVGDDKYVVLNQRDILAVVEPNQNLEYPEVYVVHDITASISQQVVFSDKDEALDHLLELVNEAATGPTDDPTDMIDKEKMYVTSGPLKGSEIAAISFVKARAVDFETRVNKNLGHDYKTAELFLIEGLKIRRRAWPKGHYAKLIDGSILLYDGEDFKKDVLTLDHTLKRDWEVVTE